MQHQHQDFTPIVWKKKEDLKLSESKKNLDLVKQRGNVEIITRPTTSNINVNKLVSNENKTFRHVTISPEFRSALSKARIAKNWSQKELAAKVNLTASVIQQYESPTGNTIPTPVIIEKLNKVLGVKLPKNTKPKIVKD